VAARCGGVLAREGVDGSSGEVLGLRGGKGEVRAASIGEGTAQRGRLLKRGGRRHSGVNPRWGGRLRCPREGGGIIDGRRVGAVCLGSDEGAEKRNNGCRWLLKTDERAG
jgi:hypothetical protein